MKSPFPGMDPFLESPENWRSFHHHLPEEIMTDLNQNLSQRYYAEVEVRTAMEELGIRTNDIIPDAAILEIEPNHPTQATAVAIPDAPLERTALIADDTKLRAVHIYQTDSAKLVTSIEVLSPFNKRSEGIGAYQDKRRRILLSNIHLIEIDLLRGGTRPGWEVAEPPIDTDYILFVNRAGQTERQSKIWDVDLDEPLPTLPVPLLLPDPDVTLDMQQVFERIYQRAVYGRRIDYTQPIPPPKLRPILQDWVWKSATDAPIS